MSPARAVSGGRVTIHGSGFAVAPLPAVTIGGEYAHVVFASSSRIVFLVPPELDGGLLPIAVNGTQVGSVSIGAIWATGLHQVDNPVFDRRGNLYVTFSGERGHESAVSIFRVTPAGTRETFASGIVNATSMAIGPDDALYVSSRFEGAVYRVKADGRHETVATDLGVACGIAFAADGSMFVGDRSGTVFRVQDARATPFATLPSSVAAFHLAMAPSGDLYVAAPTLRSYDQVYRISPSGAVSRVTVAFGRPQGVAVTSDGTLYVVDAVAGNSAVYRVRDEGAPQMVASGAGLVGLAFGPAGDLVVVSNETAYRFDS